MSVWWAFWAALAFWLRATPLHLAVVVRPEGMGAGVSLFEPRFARRAALRRLKRPGGARLPGKPRLRAVGGAAKALKYLLPRLRVELRGRIGLPDAAATALAWGAARALADALRTASALEARVGLAADFSGGGSALEGMISVRAGHIILAALIGTIDYAFGRLSAWTNTRLKTS